MSKLKIKSKEMTSLVINAISVKLLFSFPRALVVRSGSAAWIQMIYMTLIALFIFYITIKAYEKAGMQDVVTLAERIGKKPLKIVVGLVVTVILLLNMSINMRFFPEIVNEVLLPDTPMEFIILLFAVSVAFGAYMGIDSISRIHALFLPIAGVVLFIFVLLLVPVFHVNNLFPFFGKGTYNIFVKGLDELRIFADILMLNILLPFCGDKKSAQKSGFMAIGISGFVGTLIAFVFVLIFPYPASEEFVTPLYMLARLVRIGRFFQRLEAVFEFIWSIAMLLYSSLYLFALCQVWKETFGLKYYKPVIVPMITLVVMLSLLPETIVDLYNRNILVSAVLYPMAFALPIIIGILYRFKVRRRDQVEKG